MSQQRNSVFLIAGLFVTLITILRVPSVELGTAGSNIVVLETVPDPVRRDPIPVITRFAPNYAADLLNIRRWQKNELSVYITQPEGETKRSYISPVIKGADMWKPYIADVLSVRFVDDPAKADIRVSFVDHGTLPHGAIGRTEVSYRNQDNIIVVSTIRIDRTLSNDLITQVAAHELGHALGLEGHSDSKKDLMYARAHLPCGITERDSNTLRLNYSLQAARADAKPLSQIDTPQIATPEVVSNTAGTHTVAACSLPEDDR